MDDDIAEIKEEPARLGRPLVVVGENPLSLQPVADLVVDGGELPLRLATDEDEVVGVAADITDVKQDNVARLLISRRLYRLTRYVYRFQ